MTQKNRPQKPTEPRGRMGVFKSLESVPPRYRLAHHVEAYEGRDVWAKFMGEERERYDSERFIENCQRVERRWKDHMADRDRHHALATPKDVEVWFEALLEGMKPRSAYNPYWVRLEAFYDWLLWNRDHSHVYNPVLMAAEQYPTAGRLWEEKIAKNDKR